MFSQKGNKGQAKDYNNFLKDEIDDYYFDNNESDPIEKYEKKLLTIAQKTTPEKLVPQSQASSKRHQKVFKHYRSNVDLLPNFKNFSKDAIITFSSYLSLKTLLALSSVCKYLKKQFDENHVWIMVIYRDFFNLTPSHRMVFIDTKSLYRYLLILKKMRTESQFNSTVLIKNTKTLVEELESGLGDILSSKSLLLQNIIDKYTLETGHRTWTSDLRVSWMKEKSGVAIWLAGFEKSLQDSVASNTIGLAKIIGNYAFFGKGKNIYFLGKKYLVIEVEVKNEDITTEENQNDKKEEIQETFIIIDLELYLGNLKLNNEGQQKQSSFRLTFKKTLSVESNTQETNLIQAVNSTEEIVLKIVSEEFTQVKIKVKVLKNGDFVFYTEGTKNPDFVHFIPNSQNTLKKFTLKLNSPIDEIFFAKRFHEDNVFPFYISHQDSSFSIVTKTSENFINIKTKFFESLVNIKQDSQQILEEKENRGHLVHRKYHHGLYTWKTTTEEKEVEFIVCYTHKDHSFQFIDLDKFEKDYRYPSITSKEGRCDWGWDIHQNKLYIFDDFRVHLYEFTLLNQFEVNPTIIVMTALSNYRGDSKAWNFTNSCYNVSVKVSPCYNQPFSEIGINIYSTQNFKESFSFSIGDPLGWVQQQEIRRHHINFLNYSEHKEYDDRVNELLNEIDISFIDHIVLVRISKRILFVDIENFIGKVDPKKAINNSNPHFVQISLNSLEIPEEKKEEEKEEKKEKKEKKFIEIHENPNINKGKATQKNNWKQSHKKKVDEEAEEERTINRKGDKYYKNVRQKKHFDKLND